jgi:hypothetical protein
MHLAVAYKNKPGVSVALCIRSKRSADPDLVPQVGKTFGSSDVKDVVRYALDQPF